MPVLSLSKRPDMVGTAHPAANPFVVRRTTDTLQQAQGERLVIVFRKY